MLVKRPRFLDPKADIVFKKIFGQHPNLIKSFLNGILPLPKDRLIETITYLTPEQSPRIPSMKNTIVDVKCTDQQGHIFIVEMQMSWSKSFMKRFLFGTSKAYVQQLEAGRTYSSLCPVYGLAIVNQEFEEQTEDWFHHYRLTNVKDMDKTLEGMELIFLELPKFSPKTLEDRKIGVLWLRFLREAESWDEIPEEFQGNPEVVIAMGLAQESAYTPEELETYDEYLDAIRVEGTIREDSLEEGLAKGREEGEQIGMAKGREEGREEGEQIGVEKEKKTMACKMLSKGFSLEAVSELTGLSVTEIKSLLS